MKPRRVPPFDKPFPVIGMVHLAPLPGAPGYRGLGEVIERAVADAEALVEGGVDGVMVENFGDAPFPVEDIGAEALAAFSRVLDEIRGVVGGRPLGVNVLRNSGAEAVALACSHGASFIRVNALAEPVWAPEGLLLPVARRVAAAMARAGCRPVIYGDVWVKHGVHVFPLRMAVEEAVSRGLADVLVVSGARTGAEAEAAHIAYARRVSGRPVVIGSGVGLRNIRRYLVVADGAIIGTFFKKDGRVENPVDPRRVEALMDVVHRFRGRLE